MLRISLLIFSLNSKQNSLEISRLDVLVCSCPENKHRQITWILLKILKGNARTKGYYRSSGKYLQFD